MQKKILIVDDEQSIREFFQILLKRMSGESEEYSFSVVFAEDGKKALELLQKQSFDMVISDLKMPHLTGIQLLEKTKALQPEAVFIIITAFDTSETAVRAMKMGAYDYIPKPFSVDEIKMTVLSALKLKQGSDKDRRVLKQELNQKSPGKALIGQSPAMKKIFEDIKRIAHSTSNILITGESGTGKEVIARAIHEQSPLGNMPFVAVNCGAIPETLIESEMFGHKKGSFTGAVADRKGFFEIADGGALFLDEIGELPMTVQPKLLRALQEKVIRMVGDTEDKRVEVRLICATNRDLEKMIKADLFREDLFYRLNVVRIHIPPLRERKEDIPLLARHFLEKYIKKLNCPVKTVSDKTLEFFQKHSYPGNVRELENLIERVLILCTKEQITGEDILPFLRQDKPQITARGKGLKLPLPEEGIDLETAIMDLEKSFLSQALHRSDGKKKTAAELLGLSLRAFKYRLHKHRMLDEPFE